MDKITYQGYRGRPMSIKRLVVQHQTLPARQVVTTILASDTICLKQNKRILIKNAKKSAIYYLYYIITNVVNEYMFDLNSMPITNPTT